MGRKGESGEMERGVYSSNPAREGSHPWHACPVLVWAGFAWLDLNSLNECGSGSGRGREGQEGLEEETRLSSASLGSGPRVGIHVSKEIQAIR